MQWENSKMRELPAIDEVGRILGQRMPEQHGVSIAHGDYRFGNCLTDVKLGRISAVLDWELCTLGDPLADVGYLGVYWSDGDQGMLSTSDPTPAGGFLQYADVLERYATRTGRDLSDIGYYVAFSCWRLAIISEGVRARYRAGVMGDQVDTLDDRSNAVEMLADRALTAMRSLT